jgi:hypothetical protein
MPCWTSSPCNTHQPNPKDSYRMKHIAATACLLYLLVVTLIAIILK